MALNACLVIGGCGFIGYHLVSQLLQEGSFDKVYILDIDTGKNRRDGATYIAGDIASAESMHALLGKIKPTVVFHAASPRAALPASREGEYWRTNVLGTKTLLKEAAKSHNVKALVYTSTVDIYYGPDHLNVTEDRRVWPESDRSNEYNRTKAIGDSLALGANCEELRTCCLRLGHCYGDKQSQGLIEAIKAPMVQVGDGKNLMEVASAENVAICHVLAAKALLRELDRPIALSQVGGEAFNVSDGHPVQFWHHTRVIWKVGKGEVALEQIKVVPVWVMVVVVVVAEWLYYVLTFNTVKPPIELRRTALDYCIRSHTYSVEKARRLLDFNPVSNHDQVLAAAVRHLSDNRTRE